MVYVQYGGMWCLLYWSLCDSN